MTATKRQSDFVLDTAVTNLCHKTHSSDGSPPDLAAIILAAGASSRMGRPKQLLMYEGQTLLRRAIHAAEAAGCCPIKVVLGCGVEALQTEVAATTAQAIVNADWQKGIGTSIRHGVAALLDENPATDRVVLMLADQPHVTADTIRALDHAQRQTQSPICAAAFEATIGPPVIVTGPFIRALLELPDDRGAKAIWTDHPEALTKVPRPEAAIDVDTPESYAALLTPPFSGR